MTPAQPQRPPAAPAADGLDVAQRFVAYAAHELRGEIAAALTVAEATLADPGADMALLREMGQAIVASCQRQEQLLEALLTLARSEHGQLRREPVDLAATATEALRVHGRPGLTCSATLDPAWTAGDPTLIERLVANVTANAIRHNRRGGRIRVATFTVAGRAAFAVANTGPVIPSGELARLFQPFQRLDRHPRTPGDGIGLGLAIVRAIADVHAAAVAAHTPPAGGLTIEVAFPALA